MTDRDESDADGGDGSERPDGTDDLPDRAEGLHRPDEDGAGRTLFAFDRDHTVDVNPPPDGREAVPVEWVAHLAHRTDHIVYATGNQALKREVGLPGIAEILDAHPAWDPPWEDAGDERREETGAEEAGRPDYTASKYPSRREGLQMLRDLYPAADPVVVDDVDLSDLAGWTHYTAWAFVPAARRGEVVPELPPEDPSAVEDLIDPY